MGNVWFTSDTHFNHEKVIQFESTARNFSSIQQHDEELVKRWNDRVRPKDIVWHLGDVYLGKDKEHFRWLMKELNGSKRLVRGNHDTFDCATYYEAFDEIYGVWPKYGFVMSHVPLHPDSINRWGLNVHGHLHSNKVMHTSGPADGEMDNRYYCVSVEQHNLAPVSLDEIRKATA